MFISFILLSILGLAFLNYKAHSLNGLTLPTNNSLVLSILENYVPTIFSTFLEPVWVVLNRQICLLQPFDELRKGNTPSSKSLAATYSSLPPQLNIWRAVILGHYLLAIVCLTSLSNNILAVTLSTLVNEGIAETNQSIQSTQRFNSVINSSQPSTTFNTAIDYSDHFYMLLANLTHHTLMPPWLDRTHYHLQFDLNVPSTVSASVAPTVIQGYKATTIGFGATVNCTNLLLGSGPDTYQFNVSTNGSKAYLSTTHRLPSGGLVSCLASIDSHVQGRGDSDGYISIGTIPTGSLALEIMQAMNSPFGFNDGGYCSSLLIAGWARAIPSDSSAGISNITDFETQTSSSFISCTNRLHIAEFDVYVDPSGRLKEANQTKELSANSTQYFTGDATELSLITNAAGLILPDASWTAGREWHNTSTTSDWMNAMLVAAQGTNSLVDPSVPVPNGTAIAPLLEQIYTQLFGLLLALNADSVFVPKSANETLPIQVVVSVQRLFVDQSMFRASMVILLVHLIVAIAIYVSRPKSFLPRMPISIAAILSYVTASRALDDFVDHDGGSKRSHKEQRYAFGRYIGTDGKSHVGIEQQRFVVPLESKNPEIRRRRGQWGLKGVKKVEPKTWI